MPQHTRPNVLLVVADQMRRDALGLNRPAFVHTPHLDQLAREGVNFTRAYSACPSCIAARASLRLGFGRFTTPSDIDIAAQQIAGLEQFDTLSQGMTDDLDAAVRAGSTMVRVGSGIFGKRTYADPT